VVVPVILTVYLPSSVDASDAAFGFQLFFGRATSYIYGIHST
jgi:hypothetical protein